MAEPETPPFDPIDEPEAPDPQPEAVQQPDFAQTPKEEPFSIDLGELTSTGAPDLPPQAAPQPADGPDPRADPFAIDSPELPSVADILPGPSAAPTEPKIPDELFSLDLLNTAPTAGPEAEGHAEQAPAGERQNASAAVAPLPFEFDPVRATDSADEPGTRGAEPQSLVRQGVRIGPLRLLLDFASTSQLSPPVPITPLPAMPHGLRGLASLHGNVLPVFDLASMLSVTRGESQREMLLVVGHGDSAAAVLIDGLPDRFRLSDADRSDCAPPDGWLAECVLSAYSAGGEAWLDIDHRRLLDRLEASLRAPQR